MSSNHLNTPIQQSFAQGSNRVIGDNNQLLGKNLPAHVVSVSGNMVTVAFDVQSEFTLPNVTIPLYGAEFFRYPMNDMIGCKGAVVSFDASLGGNSGLGSGVASLSQPSNLGALVFLPFSNTAWAACDPGAITCYGSDGVLLRDTDSNSIFTLTPSAITIIGKDSVVASSGSSSMQLNSDGSFNISGTLPSAISAGGGLTLSDGINIAELSNMKSVFNSMIEWMNVHYHVDSMSGNTTVSVPQYTGGNPIES